MLSPTTVEFVEQEGKEPAHIADAFFALWAVIGWLAHQSLYWLASFSSAHSKRLMSSDEPTMTASTIRTTVPTPMRVSSPIEVAAAVRRVYCRNDQGSDYAGGRDDPERHHSYIRMISAWSSRSLSTEAIGMLSAQRLMAHSRNRAACSDLNSAASRSAISVICRGSGMSATYGQSKQRPRPMSKPASTHPVAPTEDGPIDHNVGELEADQFHWATARKLREEVEHLFSWVDCRRPSVRRLIRKLC